jgi:beta-lactamase class A
MSPARLLRSLRDTLDQAGLRGSFLVRDLDSGAEIGIDPDLELPIASLIKVPLALAVLERIHRGELEAGTAIEVQPGAVTTPGPTGLTKFRHPARIAIEDLVYLSTCISDGVAADALFALVPPAEVTTALRAHGLAGISARHTISDLTETPAERLEPAEGHLAHSLAIDAGTAGGGHRIRQLDVSRANAGSATALTGLLQELWRPRSVPTAVAERVRELMADNVLRQRLTPDFSSDASRWSAKTGTLLNLRHEMGVVEHAEGRTFAVVALTESRVAAGIQPAAEAVMAQVARRLRDHLR